VQTTIFFVSSPLHTSSKELYFACDFLSRRLNTSDLLKMSMNFELNKR